MLNREVIEMKNKIYNSPLFKMEILEEDVIMNSPFGEEMFDYNDPNDPSVKDFY